MRHWSPYTFSFDNPVKYADPLGLEGTDSTGIDRPKTEAKKDNKGDYNELDNVTVTAKKKQKPRYLKSLI